MLDQPTDQDDIRSHREVAKVLRNHASDVTVKCDAEGVGFVRLRGMEYMSEKGKRLIIEMLPQLK